MNAFDYIAIIVYFTVLKLGTLYLAWYSPLFDRNTLALDLLFRFDMSYNARQVPRPATPAQDEDHLMY